MPGEQRTEYERLRMVRSRLAETGGHAMKPPRCLTCGSARTEEHGAEPGDYNWYFCRDCGAVWPTGRQEELDRERRRNADDP